MDRYARSWMPANCRQLLRPVENAPRPDAWSVRTGAMRHFDSSRSSRFSPRNELRLSGLLGSPELCTASLHDLGASLRPHSLDLDQENRWFHLRLRAPG